MIPQELFFQELFFRVWFLRVWFLRVWFLRELVVSVSKDLAPLFQAPQPASGPIRELISLAAEKRATLDPPWEKAQVLGAGVDSLRLVPAPE